MTVIPFDPARRAGAPVARRHRLVQAWLIAVAALIFAMVIVGGATRLTDSGLSITEWQPLLGAIPPLNDADWAAAFEKYRQIPQFAAIHRSMDVGAFKLIFWWEWAHRFLGRFIGVAFLIPFLGFLAFGEIERKQAPWFIALFALGGLQGAVGWWMVASGLADRIDVAPYRLALHLSLACLIFAAMVWTAGSLDRPAQALPRANAVTRFGAGLMVAAVFVQIFLGGLVAGNDAGLVYATWPSMNGRFIPEDILAHEPLWRNFFENPATVQFMHRLGAYAIAVLALIQCGLVAAGPARPALSRTAWLLIALVGAQVAIGILTLVNLVPISLALLHQGTAILVLAAAVLHARAAMR